MNEQALGFTCNSVGNISEGGGVFTPNNFLIHESDL